MGAFATMAAAEVRAKAKVKDGTWINAHAARNINGVIVVRVQRKMNSATSAARQNGGWIEISDDTTV